MVVFLSATAERKLLTLTEYLLENWGLKAKNDFVEKLTQKIRQLALYPESCPKSTQFQNLYKCVVTKQTTLYYRITTEQNAVEIITVFDTRQDAQKLKKDL